jgi:hypothetical protein
MERCAVGLWLPCIQLGKGKQFSKWGRVSGDATALTDIISLVR